MSDYTSVDGTANAGTTVLARTGSAASDTIPAGSTVLWTNTGAGAHVVTITTNNTAQGLAVADRTISIPAGTAKVGKVPEAWGDATGKCAVAIDGTATEVKYYIFSA